MTREALHVAFLSSGEVVVAECAGRGRKRVGFFVGSPFYHTMLDPIYELLKNELPCLMTGDPRAMVAYSPHILVHAGEEGTRLRSELREAIFVWTRHGFSTKKNAARISITGCDFACVSSEWMREEFDRRGWRPRLGYWMTGFVPMDEMLAAETTSGTALLPDDFSNGEETLLYAPTWNCLLSSAEVLGRQWIDHIREVAPGVNVIIKPHPVIPEVHPEWMDMWRSATRRNERTLLIENADSSVFPYFSVSSILMTDASSVMFYFLAMNRPIVLVSNPRRFRDRVSFDPSDLEWQWRDMGIEISGERDLPNAILRCLQHPEEKAAQRTSYRKQVFDGLLDGQAAERVANRIRALVQPKPEDREWVQRAWSSIATSEEPGRHRGRVIGVQVQRTLWQFLRRHPRLRSAWRKAAERFPAFHYAIARLRGRLLLVQRTRLPAECSNAED